MVISGGNTAIRVATVDGVVTCDNKLARQHDNGVDVIVVYVRELLQDGAAASVIHYATVIVRPSHDARNFAVNIRRVPHLNRDR